MSRDRRGESRQVLGAVRDRHEAIQKIERQMIELAELFNDMERMVVEQEPMVQAIETSAEETHTNVQQANTELHTATNSARAARKKKWICFWIVGTFERGGRSNRSGTRMLTNMQLSLSLLLLLLSSSCWQSTQTYSRATRTAVPTTSVRSRISSPARR